MGIRKMSDECCLTCNIFLTKLCSKSEEMSDIELATRKCNGYKPDDD